MDSGAYLSLNCFLCVCIFSYFFVVPWVATIVDLRVFWQPGSITNILNCHECHFFESNK